MHSEGQQKYGMFRGWGNEGESCLHNHRKRSCLMKKKMVVKFLFSEINKMIAIVFRL